MGGLKIKQGERFGCLEVVSQFYKMQPNGRKRSSYSCLCDCGRNHNVDGGNLRNGNTFACPSCAAKLRSAHRKKPNRDHRAYGVYKTMKARCYNKNSKSYCRYGGKGVTVCDRWLESFDNFIEDMGLPEDGQSIDRIDYSGNYDPSNCKWATIEEQANNKHNIKLHEYQGKSQSIAQWCRELNLNYGTIKTRINRYGMSFIKAINYDKERVKEKYVVDGVGFSTLKSCAKHFRMSVNGVNGRFNSESYPTWIKL